MIELLRKLLIPASFIFGLIVKVRNELYDGGFLKIENAGVPVISVGNLSTGGTGKTPIAAFLLSEIQKTGYRPAYLSRGYGRLTKGYQRVSSQDLDASLTGEEALMIAKKFPDTPVAVCEDRIIGAKNLLAKEKIEIIVLDDAFQHRKIYRDLDIVILDAENPAPLLLPAGNGREGLSSLRRADIVMVNKWSDPNQIAAIRSKIQPYLSKNTLIVFCRPKLTFAIQPQTQKAIPLSQIKEAVVFAGIGNNQYFKKQLIALGIKISRFYSFPDHHSYSDSELDAIINFVKENQTPFLLTTEKDYIRLLNRSTALASVSTALHYVPMEWEWESGKTELIEKIKSLMNLYYP